MNLHSTDEYADNVALLVYGSLKSHTCPACETHLLGSPHSARGKADASNGEDGS